MKKVIKNKKQKSDSDTNKKIKKILTELRIQINSLQNTFDPDSLEQEFDLDEENENEWDSIYSDLDEIRKLVS